MSTQPFSKPLSGDAIKTAVTLRNHLYVTQSIRISTLDSVDDFEKTLPEGWEVEKQYKTTIKIRKNKPDYEVFTDRVWSTLARMGFREISEGNSLRLPFLDDRVSGLFDFYAKDDETAIFVKCIDAPSTDKHEIERVIDNYDGTILPQLYTSIRKIYGADSNLKIKMVLFCSGVLPTNNLSSVTENSNIAVYDKKHLDYFNSLVGQLKHAARYQFLAYLFRNQRINNLHKKVIATKGKMGNQTFYTFLLHPNDLLKISFVSHKTTHMSNDVSAYQRMLKPKRLKDIAEFLNNGGKFPTNIVVNLKSNKKSKLQFEKKEDTEETSLGMLTLPANYASAWIVDGQHRLYGYAYAEETGKIKNNKSLLPVMAFDNLSEEEEMKMFIDLNSKQVKVPPQILVELSADIYWESADQVSAYQALVSRLILKLNDEESSPFHNRMMVSGTSRAGHRVLGLESINVGIRSSRLLGSVRGKDFISGPFSTDNSLDYTANLEKSYSILCKLFGLLMKRLPQYWNPNIEEDSLFAYLCTNIGVRALLLVFKDVAKSIEVRKDVRLVEASVDAIVSEFQRYLEALINYFETTPVNELIEKWDISGSSAALVTRHARQLGVIIHDNLPYFHPEWLTAFLEEEKESKRISCFEKISKIEKQLSEFVISRLKKVFGEDRNTWIVEGLPKELRKSLTQRREEDNRQRDEEKYLFLIEYRDICHHNWMIFRDTIPLNLTSNIDNRKVATKWIEKLNSVRNKVSHNTGDEVSSEDVRFVEDILNRVNTITSQD